MSKAIDLLKETKVAALVFETYREKTPEIVTATIGEVFENINQALALLDVEPVCQTCKDTGKISTINTGQQSYPRTTRGSKPCPDCKPDVLVKKLQADNEQLREAIRQVDVWLSCLPNNFKPSDLSKALKENNATVTPE